MSESSELSPAAGTPTRRWALAAVVGAAAGIAGATLAWRRFALHEPDTGDLWQHQFSTPAGAPLAMAELKGRPLLINFWATWCPPCVEEMPLLSRFYTQVKGNGWQMLGLAIDQPDLVQRFLTRTPVSYPIAMAGPAGVELTKKLGNAAGGLPFTVVFDRKGDIRHRKLGQLKPEDLADWLR
ncbi:MAG: TlpA family protein disulfide reductase [Proteobacteria bacterium]|nr:TlpA family protein disulfide reductase [Pseudomonadota bacterium]